MYYENFANEETPVRNFYKGKSVLITGVTGFLGRILLEKLIRGCTDLKVIYVLIRPKNKKGIEERLRELLDDKLFDLVREKEEDFEKKIVPIRGDCASPHLEINAEDISILSKEVSVVFHVASATQIMETLSVATIVNVFGTFELLKLALNMVKLECFLFVSSAYSFCPLQVIKEKVYEGRLQPKELLAILEYENAERKFEEIEEKILQWCPSVIHFTKGLAENLIQEYGQHIPVAIFRPSLIASTYKEPYSNYLSTVSGPSAIVSSAINGILKSLSCDPQAVANLVPADMCVNCIITIPWEISQNYEPPKCKVEDSVPVYSFESSRDQPITWQQFLEKSTRNGLRYPPSNSVWCYSLTLRNNRLTHYASIVFQHILPAIFYDTILFLFGRKTRYWEMLMRTLFLTKSLEYATRKNTIFISRNVLGLWNKMSEMDKKTFVFDLRKLHWDEYLESYFLGIRLWALKDPMSTVKSARRKYRRFQILDKVAFCVYTATFLYVFYCFIIYVITPEWY